MKYVCDRLNDCHHAIECGGAEPHEHDVNECGKCPFQPTAKCVEIQEDLKEVLVNNLFNYVTQLSLGVFKGIHPRYPDVAYLVYIDKSVNNFSVTAYQYTNITVKLYMREDGKFSFDPSKQAWFDTLDHSLTILCSSPIRRRIHD